MLRLLDRFRGTPRRPPLVVPDVAAPIVASSASVVRTAPTIAKPVAPAAAREPSAAVLAFVETVRQLPLFSGTAMQLMRSVGNDDVSTDELARTIATDVGLTAGLLRIVNSPYYGLANRVSTVAEAIRVLGMNQVRRTVLAAISQRPLATWLKDSNVVRTFWRHQLVAAGLARHVAVTQGLDGEMAYMGGLMHEVGRLALLIRHPHLTNVLLAVEGDDAGLGVDRERAHFGFDHAEVGGALLERWGLPAPIVRATTEHEDVDKPSDPLSAAVWRGNLLAHALVDEPGDIDVPTPWMFSVKLGLADRTRLLDEVAALESGAA